MQYYFSYMAGNVGTVFPADDVVMDAFNTIGAACEQRGPIKKNRNEKETYVKPEINNLNSLSA